MTSITPAARASVVVTPLRFEGAVVVPRLRVVPVLVAVPALVAVVVLRPAPRLLVVKSSPR